MGVVIGYAVQLLLLAIGLRKFDLPVLPRWNGVGPDVRAVIGQYLPMLAGSLMLGTAPIIDQAMAATLGSGSVSALGFGTKIVGLILMVGSISISRAVLPYFSRMIALGDLAAVGRTLKVYSRLILVLTIPVAIILLLFSSRLVSLIFERGSFTAADTSTVAKVQAMAALQIPFYIWSMLFVRLISAMRANHILMIGGGISFAVNLSMDYVLKERMGVAGIALSTSLVYLTSLLFLGYMLSRSLAAARRNVQVAS